MAIDALTTSGINTLINSYISTEQSKMITPLNARKYKYESMVSGYSTLSSKLDSLKSSLTDLKKTGTDSIFSHSKTATLSNSSFFSVSANSSAAIGSYSLKVNQLSKADVTVSRQDASTGAKLANGTYAFQIKSGSTTKDVSVTIDDTVTNYKESLAKINEAINSQAKEIVNSAVFSPDGTKSQMSITAKNQGSDNQIVLQALDGDTTAEPLLNFLGYSLNASSPRTVDRETTISDGSAGYVYDSAQLSAKMKFNGIDIQRNSNVISDLVTGLTFTLTGSMKDTDDPVNVNIAGNISDVKSKVENFVSKFNEVYNYVKVNTSTSTVSRGAFASDATALSLLNSMSTLAYGKVEGLGDGKLSRLSDIGITFTSDGGLKISDSSKLEKKLTDNLSEVEAMFNSDKGIATKLYATVNPYLGSSGYLSKSNESMNNTIKYISDKITSTQARIDKSADVMRGKYEQLQMQLAQLLNTQGAYYSG